MAQENGINTLNEFFNLEIARMINDKFNIINASGVFFHLEELHSVADAIRELLLDYGVFVIQFLYMKRIIENCAFDQIYHEHLLYYNLATLNVLLKRHGLEIFDAFLAPIHGGSMIAFATHKGKRESSQRLGQLLEQESKSRANELETYRSFAARIDAMKDSNCDFLKRRKHSGKRIFGFGAPAKGNTLLNYFSIGPNCIECLVEKNEMRRNLYSPGMHIPVVIEKELAKPPDIYYVLAWNFKKEILANNKHLVEQGIEFYFPIDPERTMP
jgi:hypothetical protein